MRAKENKKTLCHTQSFHSANQGGINNASCMLHILTRQRIICRNLFNFTFITLWILAANFVEYLHFITPLLYFIRL